MKGFEERTEDHQPPLPTTGRVVLGLIIGSFLALALIPVSSASATSGSPSPGTLRALKGGYRSAGDNSATGYSQALTGAWLQYSSTKAFSTPFDFLTATDLTGSTTAGVNGGTWYGREKSAPSGWRELSKLAWGGGTPTEQPYVGEAYVNGGTSTLSVDGTSSRFVNSLANPPLPANCNHGLKVLLLLDRSGSTAPYKTDYAAAAKTFVSTLADTPTSLKITSFSSSVTSGNGTSFDLSNSTDRDAANAKIDTVYSAPSGATNWDAALTDAAGAGVDVVVFITDGNPTVREGNTSSGGSTEIDDITYGIASSNNAKNPDQSPDSGDEQTMLGVAVGDISESNIAAVSGPTPGKDYTTAKDPSELAKVLKEVAIKLCGGKVTVKKQLAPAADPGRFDLKIDSTVVAEGVGDGGTGGPVDVAAGAHSVSEVAHAGTDLGDYASSTECRNKSGSVVGAGGTFEVKPDDEISCVITNTRRGSITVHKSTVPAGAPGSFSFTGDPVGGSFSLSDGGKHLEKGLVPGKYSFTESVPAGWLLTDLSCKGTAAKPAVSGSKVTIDLAAGENADCTYTNTKLAKVTIAKATDPTSATDKFSFSGPGDPPASFELANGESKPFADLAPGEGYSWSEKVPAGWTLTGIKCTGTDPENVKIDASTVTVTPGAGEDVACTYTNTKLAKVTIAKATNPTSATDKFSFSGPGDPPASFELANGESKPFADLAPGEGYSWSEKVPAGW
ncbi:MAG: vWA domain-containing protein, partial [Actinomycetes bacterium]